MILTGPEIIKQVKKGNIIIDNFDEKRVNPNSYNVLLDPKIKIIPKNTKIDLRKKVNDRWEYIDESGYILKPGNLYLGSTIERAGSDKYITCLEGRSSFARLGICVHETAGFGDIGFTGKWTLEISVRFPTKIYPNIEIAQVYFMKPIGKRMLYTGKYSHQDRPTSSMLYKELSK